MKKIVNFLTAHKALIAIILLASFLRLFQLSNIPISLNIDEMAIGYNSFSFLHSGADEYGKLLNLTYQSFGDWKLSGYPLIAAPFIAAFGLSEFSTRLPSALAGIIQVMLVYFLCLRMFGKKNIAIAASFFFAISPWSIYFSRIAYEVNLATTFFAAGILFLLKGYQDKKSVMYIFAAICISLTMLIYHSYIIATPIFIVGLLLLFYKKIKFDKNLVTALIVVGVFGILSFIVLANSYAKFSDLSVLNSKAVIYDRAEKFKTDGAIENPLLSKILYNKYVPGPYQVAQNYLLTFSPTFLFDKGGNSLMGNLGYLGLFYIFDSILIIIGLIKLIESKVKSTWLLLLWILVAPIPSAITQDAPSSTRLFMILPPLVMLSGYGVVEVLTLLKNIRFSKIIITFVGLLFLWNIALFMDGYFVHMKYQRAVFQHYGYKQVVEIARSHPDKNIIMESAENFPYISFLFHNQTLPQDFRKTVSYYTDNKTKFVLVKGFDRYRFVGAIDYDHLEKDTLYFDTGEPNLKLLPKNIKIHTVQAPSGEVVFWYFLT